MNFFVRLTGWLSWGQPNPRQSKSFMFMCFSLPIYVPLSLTHFSDLFSERRFTRPCTGYFLRLDPLHCPRAYVEQLSMIVMILEALVLLTFDALGSICHGQQNRYTPQIILGEELWIAVTVLAMPQTNSCYSYSSRWNSERTHKSPQPITVTVLNFGGIANYHAHTLRIRFGPEKPN